MDDLISRKALDREMSMQLVHAGFKSYSDAGQMYLKAKQIVRSAPAVDAAPVVHGRWVAMHYEGGILDGANCERCSNCGWDRFFDEPEIKSVFRYCPKCGALMDGGNDND